VATSALYTIRINGRLGGTALSAFPSMAPARKGGETVLTGPLVDRSAVFGVLGQIEALGLDLLEFRQIETGIGTRRRLPCNGTRNHQVPTRTPHHKRD